MFQFKRDLKLGTASASAQIEGGEINSNWNTYSDAGKILDGSNVKRANDHWNRYEEDIDLLDQLDIRYYRMSLEWARIEPVQGTFDYDAILHYRDEISKMKEKGIEVLVTLHHFSHPQWFEDLGAFAKKENIPIFLKYVEYAVKQLGDLIPAYCTINEPNVYAVNCFLFGEWLNEEKKFFKTLRVMSIFATAHIKAYQLIHDIYQQNNWGDVNVTFALHMRWFTPAKDNFIDRTGAKIFHYLFQGALFETFATGRFKFPFSNFDRLPEGKYLDTISVNYYSRGIVQNFNDKVKKGVPKSDLGWEINPQGLIECAKRCYEIMPLPIMVTENGTCDNQDDFRPRYIYDHLKAINDSDLPFTHYYYWCFLDNFEWKEGELPRFGLIHCDYETQKRTIKRSGFMYKEVIANQGFTEEMYQKYVEPAKYHHGERNILSEFLPPEEYENHR